MNLMPLTVAEILLRAWSTGVWWDELGTCEDPLGQPPVRVRAGAIVVRDERMLLIERREHGERWFEIPGGGVEAGETPVEAVVRELREETGLAGSVVAEVATVFRDGGRQHYFRVEARGVVGDRAGLDLEEDARLVWTPVAGLARVALWPKRLAWRIAGWHANGWPAAPVQLSDSMTDLSAPCDW